MSIISIITDRFLEEFRSDLHKFETSSAAKTDVMKPEPLHTPAQLPPHPAQLSIQAAQLSNTATCPIALDV